jgi:hypothetical protein
MGGPLEDKFDDERGENAQHLRIQKTLSFGVSHPPIDVEALIKQVAFPEYPKEAGSTAMAVKSLRYHHESD